MLQFHRSRQLVDQCFHQARQQGRVPTITEIRRVSRSLFLRPSKDERAVSKGTDQSENSLTVESVGNPTQQGIARVANALDRIHDRRRAAGVGISFSEVGEVLDFGVIDAANYQRGYNEKHKKFHGVLHCDGAPDCPGQASGAKSAIIICWCHSRRFGFLEG